MAGSDTRPLASYAKVVAADDQGEIQIDIVPQTFSLDVSVGAVAIRELDPPAVRVTIAANEISEGAGADAAVGIVTRNSGTAGPLEVSLASSDAGEATVPATVTIPDGSTFAEFSIDAVDDPLVDGAQTVTITATAADHNGGSDTIQVTDDETERLGISFFADAVIESGGAGATSLTLTRTGDTTNPLTVALSSDDPSVAVPATVTIPAFSDRTLFPVDVDVTDDTVDGGNRIATITATAGGFVAAEGPLTIVDDDVSPSALNIEVAADQINEGDGPAATTLVVSRSAAGASVTHVGRGVFTDDSLNGFQSSFDDQTGGFTSTIRRESPTSSVDVTEVDLNSDIGPLGFDGFGYALFDTPDGTLSDIDNRSVFDVFFDVTTPQAYSLVGFVGADTDQAFASSGISLRGPGVDLSFGHTSHSAAAGAQVDIDTSGVLGPGTYHFMARASVTGGGSNQAADADFQFDFQLSLPETVVDLSGDATEVVLPASTTIPAGALVSPTVDVGAFDDTIVDGTQAVDVTASATGFQDGGDTVDVIDNDVVSELSVAITDTSIPEDGTTAATVTRTGDLSAALVVTLASSDESEATVPVPPTVTIAAGQATSPSFPILGVQDQIVDGTQNVTITVSASGYTSGTGSLQVTDIDVPSLLVTIQADSISENGGSTTATVRRTGPIDSALDVVLSSGDETEATVAPLTVTIPAGQENSAPFDIVAVDDSIIDGTQTVAITSTADGYTSGTDTIEVSDDEVAGFNIEQTDGYSLVFESGSTDEFTVVLTARPQSNVTLDVLSADVGEVTVSPTTLVFSPDDWDQPKLVTVAGVPDPLTDGSQSTAVTVAVVAAATDPDFTQLADQDVVVTTRDVGGSIEGSVWNDADGNQQNNGEPFLGGVTVYLDLNRNGALDVGEPTQVTASDGSYRFDELAAGEYVVAQVVPEGLAQTFPEVIGTPGTFAQLVNNQSFLTVAASHAPHDVSRLFVVEKNNASIRVLDLTTGQLNPTPFLTIPDVDAGANEAGLLGIAFHPDYANNGKFYVNVTVDNSPDTNFATHIREYRVSSSDPNVADPDSAREILSYAQPFDNHNGGWIGFSPNDGYLYISSGDGGSGGDPLNNGQRLDTLLGKMIRIDVDGDDFPSDPDANYAIPPSNPFVGVGGAREEIWAYGLRNPWRSSFDSVTGDLWIGDVGQNAREEIDFQGADSAGGENYAWNRREGFAPFNGGQLLPGDVEPVYDYTHGSGPLQGSSVVGGHVYRGPIPELQGLYIFADSRSSNVWLFDPSDPSNTVRRINDSLIPDAGSIGGGSIPDDIVAFSEDGSGNLYLVQIDGEIHRVSQRLPGTHTVIVEAGAVVDDIDFGNQDPQAGSIGDFVWHDLDADGVQDPGEPGLGEVTVNLLDATSLNPLASVTTGPSGAYSFGGLNAGAYVVEFVAPQGFLFSPTNATVDASDSDADGITGRTELIQLPASTSVDTLDAGLFQLASIGDRVWDDADGNGIQDNGERPLENVRVDLIRIDDFEVDADTQNWKKHPDPGNPVQPSQVPTGGPAGDGDGYMIVDSTGQGGAGGRLVVRNESQWTGDFSAIVAIEADVRNFGNTMLNLRIALRGNGGWFATNDTTMVPLAAGSDWTRVMFTVDANSLQHVNGSNDLAATLASVDELRILSSDVPEFRGDMIPAALGLDNIAASLRSTETNPNGIYRFDVLPGAYRLRFNAPDGRLISPQQAASNDDIDSDAGPSTGVTRSVPVVSGQLVDSIDAGMFVPALTLTIDPTSISENAGIAVATVTRNTDDATPLIVNLSSGDDGEASVADTVTIPADQSSTTFVITGVDDDLVDGTQVVTISVSASEHASDEAEIEVTDDDIAALTLTIQPTTIAENGNSATATVTRNTPASNPLLVLLNSSDTTEATVPETIIIPEGRSSITFPVNSVDDLVADGTQPATITATAEGHNDAAFAIEVTDDDEAQLSLTIDPMTISENGGRAEAVVSRNTPAAAALVVTLSSSDTGEASVQETITIPAGAMRSEPFPVNGVDDSMMDGPQSVIVTASAAEHAAAAAEIIVTDDDVATLSIEIIAAEISEDGGRTVAIVSRNDEDPGSLLVVNLDADPEGELGLPSSITIPAGMTAVEFPIEAENDEIVDGDHNVIVTVSAEGYQSDADSVVVLDDDLLTLTLAVAPTTIREDGTAEAKISRNDGDLSQPLIVTLLAGPADEVGLPPSITIPAEARSAEFLIAGVNDSIVDGDQQVSIRATAPDYIGDGQGIVVTDINELGLTVVIEPDSISENGGVATAMVVRNDGDLSEALVVTLSADPSDEVSLPLTVTIPANSDSEEFTITGVDDRIVDGSQKVTIVASAEAYEPGEGGVEVTDDDVLTLQVRVAAESIAEDGSTEVTVVRNDGTPDSPLTVNLSTLPENQMAVPDSVVIPTGEDSVTFAVFGIDDPIVDGPQVVVIGARANEYQGGTASLEVRDNDVAGFNIEETESGGSTRVHESGTPTDEVFVYLNAAPLTEVVFDIGVSDSTEASVDRQRLVFTPDNWDVRQELVVTGVDDDIVDGPIESRLVVGVVADQTDPAFAGLESQSVAVITEDNDRPELRLEILAPAIGEEDGAGATTAVVSRNTDTSQPLVVTLISEDNSEVGVQETVTIPAGSRSSEPFNIDAIDDQVIDGDQVVIVRAEAPNHASATDTVIVEDDDQGGVVITAIETSAPRDDKARVGDTVAVEGTFTGGSGELSIEVDWGDGTVSDASIDPGEGVFGGKHEYETGGIFTVTVTITDSAGMATASVRSFVSGARVTDDGVLQIIGTDRRDRFHINPRGNELKLRMRLHGDRWKTLRFKTESVSQIQMVLCDGSDVVRISDLVKIPASIEADGGNDFVRGGGGDTKIDGGPGNDLLVTGSGNDVVVDMSGHNTIRTGRGHDEVATGFGHDRVTTSTGNDVVVDQGGVNFVSTGSGHDQVTTGDGRDLILTSSGEDTIRSGGGFDIIFAGRDSDHVDAGGGSDLVIAGAGHDIVRGGDGHDAVNGGPGNDILLGGSGNDLLIGSSGPRPPDRRRRTRLAARRKP